MSGTVPFAILLFTIYTDDLLLELKALIIFGNLLSVLSANAFVPHVVCYSEVLSDPPPGFLFPLYALLSIS